MPPGQSGAAPIHKMSAMDQFQFIQEFNWDDDLKPLEDILGSKSCPLEAAVLAFWRGEGPSYFIGEHDRTAWLGPMMMSLGEATLSPCLFATVRSYE